MIAVYLRSQKRNQEYAELSVSNTVLIFLFIVPLASLFREKGMIVAHYAAPALSALIGLFLFRVRLLNRSALPDMRERNIMLKIAFISMINDGLSHLLYLLDVFVLGIVDPQETVLASYKVATMIPSAIVFIPAALVTYLYPYFAEHQQDHTWCRKHYLAVLRWFGTFNLLLSATLVFAAPLLLQLLYGTEYLDAVPVFRILSVNYFFSGTFRIISGNLLVTQRKLKFNLFVAIVSSSVNIIGDFFFIQWWGSVGAAFATLLVVLVSSGLSTSYLLYVFSTEYK